MQEPLEPEQWGCSSEPESKTKYQLPGHVAVFKIGDRLELTSHDARFMIEVMEIRPGQVAIKFSGQFDYDPRD